MKEDKQCKYFTFEKDADKTKLLREAIFNAIDRQPCFIVEWKLTDAIMDLPEIKELLREEKL